MMAKLGYDAVTPGEREMIQGLEPLKRCTRTIPR